MSVGPVFQNKNIFKLEIIRITDSNVPSVGTYSFWGLDKLRILGKISSKDSEKTEKINSSGVYWLEFLFELDLSRNNVTSLLQDNFKGQEHLDELDLSYNKISRLTSWVFSHLTVRPIQAFTLSHAHRG